MRLKKQLVLWIGLVACFCIPAYADSAASSTPMIDGKAITLAHYAKAFVGSGNVTVEVAPYKQGDQDGAILLFHGIESAWDDKAMNHVVQQRNDGGTRYVTRVKGKPWETLVAVKGDDGATRYTLYLPDVNDPIALAPSDGAAQLTTPEKIFQEYQHHH